jgi:AcrR family transcriptional regulator
MSAAIATRDRLLTAALEVVQGAGVAGATSRQIAAAAGTNLQAITYHFGSKDELVAQALVQAVRSWVEPARRALDGLTADPVGHLIRAVWELHDSLAAAGALVPAYLEALALAPRHGEFRAQIAVLLRDLRADLATAIEELRAAGYLAAWVDPVAMAALIVAAADGTAVHLTVDPDGFDLDGVIAQVVPLLTAASTLPPALRPTIRE